MSLQVYYKKMESTPSINAYIEKKCGKFKRIITYPMDTQVTLSVERGRHTVEINCHAEFKHMVAIAKTDDLYESIDQAVRKIESQLKKEREKRKGHTAAHVIARKSGSKLASDVHAELPHAGKKRK